MFFQKLALLCYQISSLIKKKWIFQNSLDEWINDIRNIIILLLMDSTISFPTGISRNYVMHLLKTFKILIIEKIIIIESLLINSQKYELN